LIAPLATRTGTELYGYALVAYPIDGHVYLGHGGGNTGYTAHILADIDEGLGVVHLSNRRTESEMVFQSADYALKALTAASHHREIPPLPSTADTRYIPNAAEYVGTYRAGDSILRFTSEDEKLLLNYDGKLIPLEQRSDDYFYIGHPDLDLFLLEFKRDGGNVVEVFHGSQWYINDCYKGPRQFDYPAEWEAYTGHYRTRNPEMSNFRVVLRKGILTMLGPTGAVEPLRPLVDGLFRIGDERESPETLQFDSVVEGHALRASYSGCPYFRTFTK
jgi:hypothetical protein